MSSSNSPSTHESKQEKESSNSPKIHESKQEKKSIDVSESRDSQVPEGEEEELGECAFCLFMKEGGCREEFVNWEKCVEEGEKNQEDIVEKCAEITFKMRKCMEANRDYYAPILQAEEVVMKELEKEKGSDGSAAPNSPDANSQGKTINESA